MTAYDYSNAAPAREFDLIPQNTVVTLRLHIRAGGAGEDGMLKRSSNGRCEMLDVELTIVDGEFAKRKLWDHFVVEGEEHAKAIEISRGRIRAIIDSAYGLDPKDISPEARKARTRTYKQLDGLTFIGKIGIEKGGPKKDVPGESWPDKNILAAIITKDRKEWHPVPQPPPCDDAAAAAAPPSTPAAAPGSAIARPKWAS
jgi:hypothetical protein